MDGDLLLVEHSAIARLTAAQAASLDLPPLTTLRAVVDGSGPMMHPAFKVSLHWVRPEGRNVLGVDRCGAWLREPEGWSRLPESLFSIAEAVEQYAFVAPGEEAQRLRALARMREILPAAALSGTAEAKDLLGTVTILEADAFSLDSIGEGDDLQILPVLHRAGADQPHLIPEDQERLFGTGQFRKWPSVRSVYSLPGGIYVCLSPPLRQALEVVRRVASDSPARKRAFLREPRAAIRAAIGDEADAALVDSLFVETACWSERVIGLGVWQPRVLPWVQLDSNTWFGEDTGSQGRKPADKGLMIGDERITLTPERSTEVASQVRQAIAHGRPSVDVASDGRLIKLPANDDTLAALEKLRPGQSRRPGDKHEREVLIIKSNLDDTDIETLVGARPSPPSQPVGLRTTLKAHQTEGLTWLQANWRFGSPGVLLADDMGLGKTLQGLAFLAWLRQGMSDHIRPRPLLIVAPTGLLENWRAEHDKHLVMPGLGDLVIAYGKGLAALRTDAATGSLDRKALKSADWILTTYETLRDHQTDFAAVEFACVLFDEAQRVKNPGTRLTVAAKAMKADFRVAMTGTPVENRLADLWCIIDGVAPGHLHDLKDFSAHYEAEPTPEKLSELKRFLDQPLGRRPAMLLRRMKEDKLPDLPVCVESRVERPMSGRQLAAYEETLQIARDEYGAGKVLAAIHRLRTVSLHPDVDGADDEAALVSGSARLQLTLEILDQVARKRERVLIFLDDLSLLSRLPGLLQRRYDLSSVPMTISGKVSGAARQASVDRFQSGSGCFDVMLLSPRAGGVGLTITSANHVVHLARWWNPAVEDQCNARVLRIGQEREVSVHLPMATLPSGKVSFDQNLDALLKRKRQLTRDALMPNGESSEGELTDMLADTLS